MFHFATDRIGLDYKKKKKNFPFWWDSFHDNYVEFNIKFLNGVEGDSMICLLLKRYFNVIHIENIL